MKHQAAAKAAANRAATKQTEAEKTALEAAMAGHLANTSRAATLASCATYEHADAEAEKSFAEALGGIHPSHMTT